MKFCNNAAQNLSIGKNLFTSKTPPQSDECKSNDNRPADRKRHCPNTLGIQMSFLLLNKFMITATKNSTYKKFILVYIHIYMQQQKVSYNMTGYNKRCLLHTENMMDSQLNPSYRKVKQKMIKNKKQQTN